MHTIADPSRVDLGIRFPDELNSSYKSRVGALVTAYKALSGDLFVQTLNELLQHTTLTKKEIAQGAGISVGALNLMQSKSFSTATSKDAVAKIDELLGAQGELHKAYVAIMTRSRASRILPFLLAQPSFCTLMQTRRENDARTLEELAKAIKINPVRLRSWETGLTIPTLDNRPLVEHLDKELKCDGTLIERWLELKPRPNSPQLMPYACKTDTWPDRLKQQHAAFIDYETLSSG